MSTNESESDPFEYVTLSDLESPHTNQRRDAVSYARIDNPNGPNELAIFDASGELAGRRGCRRVASRSWTSKTFGKATNLFFGETLSRDSSPYMK